MAQTQQRNEGSETAVVHDNLWCSATPESEESQIIEEYANFYFSEKVDVMIIVP